MDMPTTYAAREARPAHIFRSATHACVQTLSAPMNSMVSSCTPPRLHVCRSEGRARAKWSANALQCRETIKRGAGVVTEKVLRPAGTRGARKKALGKVIGGGAMRHHATPNHWPFATSSARRTCQRAVEPSR